MDFPESLVQDLVSYLDEALDGRRAIPFPEIYEANKALIVSSMGELPRYDFQKQFSLMIRGGQVPGFEVKAGRGGGVGRAAFVDSILQVNGKSYKMTLAQGAIEKLLTKVFRLRTDLNGMVLLGGTKYTVDHEYKVMLDNFVFYFGAEVNS